MENLNSVLITGGTGSFGQAFTARLLADKISQRIVVYSRDELKQQEMRQRFNDNPAFRFFIGDVRDRDRLRRAMKGIGVVVHAAALKQVPVCEYNPAEAVKTNVLGAINVIDAAIDTKVRKVIFISTDKACQPTNLYGATKLCAEKLFVQANAYASSQTVFSVVRYGNVMNSRGSVVPVWRQQVVEGKPLTITDERMTRFWITLTQAADFVLNSIARMHGGEVFVPKLPSVRIIDLAECLVPGQKRDVVGIRPGEKLHETLISEDECRHTQDNWGCYIIESEHSFWERGDQQLGIKYAQTQYSSDTNDWWLNMEEVKQLL